MAILSLFIILLLFAAVFFIVDALGGVRNVSIKWDSLAWAFVILAAISYFARIGN